MNRPLATLGVVLVLLGAAATVGPTFGFTTTAADRGIQANVVADVDAYLGIEDVYDGTQISNTPPTTAQADAIELTNNFGEPIDLVDAEVTAVDGFNDSVLTVSNGAELYDGIATGDNVTVELGCSGDVEASGTADVTVTVVEANGSTLSVENRPVVVTGVDFDCGLDDTDGSDPAQDPTPISETNLSLVGNPIATGDDNSVVEFDVENGGDPVTITEVEVRNTTNDRAETVNDDGNSNEVTIENTNTGDVGSLNVGNWKSALDVGGGPYALDQNATLGTNETGAFTFSEFMPTYDGTGPRPAPADMVGENATIILYFDAHEAVRVDLEDIQDG